MWYEIPAVSYVRTISVDTCNTDFDTVLGVFSGSSYASLSVIACNDDRTSVYGDACYPTSSFIDNINIASGEVIYVVVGGYKNTTSGIADAGVGQIVFTVLSADNVPCTGALINETQLAIQNEITTVLSDLQTALTSTESFLNSSLSTATSTISSDMSSSFGFLSGNVSNLQNTANTIEGDVTSANSEINVLQTTADSISSNVGAAQTQINTAQTSVNNLGTQVSGFSSNVTTDFSTTQSDVSTVDSSVSSVSSSLTSVSNFLNSQLSDLQTQISNLQNDINGGIATLANLQLNIKSDTSNLIFTQTSERFLSDTSLVPPNPIRVPSTFGGQLESVASLVSSTYSQLYTNAIGIGSASSSQCTSNLFCNYFLNTAVPAYADSMAKYNTYRNANKFKTAFSYLQTAYLSLYPSFW